MEPVTLKKITINTTAYLKYKNKQQKASDNSTDSKKVLNNTLSRTYYYGREISVQVDYSLFAGDKWELS